MQPNRSIPDLERSIFILWPDPWSSYGSNDDDNRSNNSLWHGLVRIDLMWSFRTIENVYVKVNSLQLCKLYILVSHAGFWRIEKGKSQCTKGSHRRRNRGWIYKKRKPKKHICGFEFARNLLDKKQECICKDEKKIRWHDELEDLQ